MARTDFGAFASAPRMCGFQACSYVSGRLFPQDESWPNGEPVCSSRNVSAFRVTDASAAKGSVPRRTYPHGTGLIGRALLAHSLRAVSLPYSSECSARNTSATLQLAAWRMLSGRPILRYCAGGSLQSPGRTRPDTRCCRQEECSARNVCRIDSELRGLGAALLSVGVPPVDPAWPPRELAPDPAAPRVPRWVPRPRGQTPA